MKLIIVAVIAVLLCLVGAFSLLSKDDVTPRAEDISVSNATTTAGARDAEVEARSSLRAARPDRQTISDSYRFTKNLKLTDVPPELHAKSAIEVSATDSAALILKAGTKEFTVPLSSDRIAKLAINKVIERSETDTSLMGSVAGADRSHFSIRFMDGVLKSGTIKFYENGDLYHIKATEGGNLMVSLEDPDIPQDQCGCASGTH